MFEYIVILCALLLALLIAGRPWWRGYRQRKKRLHALSHGRKMETQAAKMLRRWGYRILDRHPRAEARWWVDGVTRTAVVEVDYLVKRRRRKFAVEVKTGKSADPSHRNTRRQLLEYAKTYAVDGLLLLDADRERLYEVRFDPKIDPDRWRSFALGFLTGLSLPMAFWIALH
jgi:Holliday junction resolvase-like predicted endonuclease